MTTGLPIMIQGTHSDAGKSILATALCRIFARKGFKTAPFKSQNMALNSYITIDGKEIGRAQGVQAEAAKTIATTDMNPVLIKPTGVYQSQIVVHGEPYQNMKAGEYRQDFYEKGKELIHHSFNYLSEHYERIVIEGAGSPAEINLNDRELVNMSVARIAQAPVILVGDIDKGGVFASLVGTLQLLDPIDRERVIGVVINKFRGDIDLLRPGLAWFEEYTGLPVLGVIPFIDHLDIEAEDSLALELYPTRKNDDKDLDIAFICYPRISNFTDMDPLEKEPDCHVRSVRSVEELGEPDLIILPGSKNTLEDLSSIVDNGLGDAIISLVKQQGVRVIGICGGYQMLGKTLEDPKGMESSIETLRGLSLIESLTTILTEKKRTILSFGIANYGTETLSVSGYEIHMGLSKYNFETDNEFIQLEDGGSDGYISSDRKIIGTYFHGLFENDHFREVLLNDLRESKGLEPCHFRASFKEARENGYEHVANVVENHLNLVLVEEKMIIFQQNRTC
ncbi:cobyric acid synthase CobQ [Salipaludibacillus keqinensis]|uniref:Cobyric acid synthase n=1 Tax=Salipaludibacillus keqinensis TaxID=2045207 RepID=A0A323T9S3_9BACI|nr:cobyric acid synthase [Salipaludibacillus keqinensis]PYZ92308.1 cobyric acid synthase CobQ [Salipaludibacillus keqinensis]